MLSVWAEEKNVSGRIKSVCILVLLLAVIIMQGRGGLLREETVPGNGRAETEKSILAENDYNPIDAFFADALSDVKSGELDERVCNIYLDCWEKELSHAYGILKGSRDQGASLGGSYWQEAVESFSVFAEAQSWMEAYQGKKDGRDMGFLNARKAMAKAELLRDQALRIYELLKEAQNSDVIWDGQYAFCQDEAGEALKELGLHLGP